MEAKFWIFFTPVKIRGGLGEMFESIFQARPNLWVLLAGKPLGDSVKIPISASSVILDMTGSVFY